MKLQDRIITVLKNAASPLTFEQVYTQLEGDGHGMPEDKPKLKVRKLLYKTEFFVAGKGGVFSLVEGVEAGAAAPAAPVAAPTAKPAEKKPEPAAPSVKPAEEKPAPSPAAPVSGGPSLNARAINILKKAGKPLSFQQVYDELEKDGHGLPEDKPKLRVRKVLYNVEFFETGKGGVFTLKEGADLAAAEAPVKPAAKPAPKEAPKKASPPPTPPVAKPVPEAEPAPAPASAVPAGPPLQDRVVAIMQSANKGLTFQQVYDGLEKDGHALPEDKPKLKVRKVLYNADLFDAGKGGMFTLKDGVDTVEIPTPAPAAPTAAKSVPAAEPAPALAPAAPSGPSLKDRVITVVQKAGKPVTFQQVYTGLEGDGYPIPDDKPKLKVRKVLYNAELFDAGKGGVFTVKEGVTAEPLPAASSIAVSKSADISKAAPVPTVVAMRVRDEKFKAASDNLVKAREEAKVSADKAAEKVRSEARVEADKAADKAREETLKHAHDVVGMTSESEAKLLAEKAALKAREEALREVEEAARKAREDALREAEQEAQRALQEARLEAEAAAQRAREEAREEAEAAAARAREEAREEARRMTEAAVAEAREEARRAAMEAAEQARIAAAEAAREAAIEATRMAEEREAARQAAIEAAREAAREAAAEAAKEAAAEAARIAREAAEQAAADEAARLATEQAAAEETARAAAEAARQAAAEEAARIAEAAKEAAAEEAARIAAEEAKEAAAKLAQAAASSGKLPVGNTVRFKRADLAKRAADTVTGEVPTNVTGEVPASPPEPAPEVPAETPAAPEPAPAAPRQTQRVVAQPTSIYKTSGKSIRERAVKIILEAGGAISLEDIFSSLQSDGYPLPPKNAEEVLKKVLNNPTIFEQPQPGYYYPVASEIQ